MADEITVNVSLLVKKGNLDFSFKTGALKYTQTGTGGPTTGVSSIGTSEESDALSELSTLGWVALRNLDATNYVEWGFATGVYGGRMEAGESAVFRLNPSTTLYLKANTAACNVAIYAFED